MFRKKNSVIEKNVEVLNKKRYRDEEVPEEKTRITIVLV
jgi:sulfur carrier protein ThiS